MSAPATKIAPWEDVVLRIIAIYKLLKAGLFYALGFGLLQLMHEDPAEFLRDYVVEPFHFNPETNHWVKWAIEHASSLTAHKIAFISGVALFYATLFLVEGVGLYLRKHWAEYLVLIVTGSFLPFEFYEIYLKLAWWKFAVVLGNLAILVYLVHRLRLEALNAARKQNAALSDLAASSPSAESKQAFTEVP